MPKAPRAPAKAKHDPLYVQLGEDEAHAKYGRVSQPGRRKRSKTNEDEEESGEAILDPKTSRRIFELARDQQEELDEKDLDDEDEDDTQLDLSAPRGPSLDDDDDLDLDRYEDVEEIEEIEVDEDDMRALDALLPANAGERRTLADIIFSKLDNLEGGNADADDEKHHDSDRAPDPAAGLDPKVVEVYSKVGQMLTRYKSGPLPKPFKIIPSLPQWSRILALTHPENWSPQACHAATRIFISQMKPPQARVFLEAVLLDALREDIRQTREGNRRNKNHRKLNVHYYESLKRAMYKPGAVFKGIVFPLLNSGCTLQEAAIVASVLSKVKIPLGHSAAALMRLANMDYSGANSLFIRVLLDKKHALPYKVVDALVFHFIRLSNTYKARRAGDAEKLPVLWHQSLLVFCQRYASDLTPDQKDALLDVVRVNPHPQISAEVRRELVSSVERGAPRPDADGDVAMA
ncbi:cell adhesion protein byn-1 [Trametes versicolor FP-101664 SS1]|uniref:cell adhesion protein byn-1 n=1 Tax=Trametes versicolor (strain FP-101664) TaxID=717944 RepID=UPI0004624728|nr:cell adhesion protein byn-1 [Trametes versicolor FP-101664 SS1]EIW62156.1 cell adhesion protein byn-1 [Trametes versicolor FP-101664 SS1]